MPRSRRGKQKNGYIRVLHVEGQGKFILLWDTLIDPLEYTLHRPMIQVFTSCGEPYVSFILRMATIRPHVNKSYICFVFRLRATTVRRAGQVARPRLGNSYVLSGRSLFVAVDMASECSFRRYVARLLASGVFFLSGELGAERTNSEFFPVG